MLNIAFPKCFSDEFGRLYQKNSQEMNSAFVTAGTLVSLKSLTRAMLGLPRGQPVDDELQGSLFPVVDALKLAKQ
jgi:hypothetical protein